MNVNIYSRKSIESIIADGKFPDHTAVISFYDPAIKRIDKDYTHVDYSEVCDTVFYCEVDDLDLDYLPEKGYTYDTFFPEADDMAVFIINAYMSGKSIICQCEYGQSRSAGCAAAILEYFYENGISVFSDYSYYPSQVIFHKVYDALVKTNPIYSNTLYSHEKSSHEKLNKFIDFTTGATTLFSKERIENELSEQGKLYHSFEEAFYQLRHGIAKVYVSLHIDDAKVCHGTRMGEHNVGVKTIFKYSNKEISFIIFIPKIIIYIKSKNHDYYLRIKRTSIARFRRPHSSVSFDILGIMEQDDCKEPVIERAIITNIKAVPELNENNSE